ncbi:MAG: DUF5050 domain-containing protein [Caloramator sp.]|nr:DUF5050 domain-containing protein [Caloramator sp.]
MEHRSKKIERMYYIIAGILLAGFIFSSFSKSIKDYFTPKIQAFSYQIKTKILKQEDYYTNVIKNQVKVGDTIYFIPSFRFEDLCLYAYNTKDKTLKMISKNWVSQVEVYKDCVYFKDINNTLFRLDSKNKSIEKLLDDCGDFQIVDGKIAYINSESRNVNIYDILNKTNTDLKISPIKFLYMGDTIYYYFADASGYLYEMDIKNKTYKIYQLKDAILDLMYYNGHFYASSGNIKITCYNKKFEKLWELSDSEKGVELAKIFKDRIYYYSLGSNGMNRMLMSVDLDGKNPKEELEVTGISYSNFEFVEEGNKDYLYDIKDKKKYELPEIKPVLFYYPDKREKDVVQGYRMVKVDNKLYYSEYDKIFEYNLALKSGANILNDLNDFYVSDLKTLDGNIFFYRNQLYSFNTESKTPHLVTNIIANRMFVDEDILYIFSLTNLYRICNNNIEKFLKNIWVLYIGNGKIYYYPVDNGVTNVTSILVLDTETNKKEEINAHIHPSQILYIDDKSIYYIQESNLYVYNMQTKENNILYNNIMFLDGYIVSNGKIFFDTVENGESMKFKINCLDINTNKLTTVVEDIANISSYLYDEKQKKLYYTISNYYDVREASVK